MLSDFSNDPIKCQLSVFDEVPESGEGRGTGRDESRVTMELMVVV